MRNLSTEFREQLNKDNRNFLKYADIILNDGRELHLSNSQLWENGFKFEDSVSGDSVFDIGSAIVNKFSLTLNNIYDDFTDYVFDGAKVDCWVGLELTSGIEKIRICTGIVVEAPYQNSTIITLTCQDNMMKFDRDYTDSKLVYPATRHQIVRDACEVCGVTLATATFDRGDYLIPKLPLSDANLTFRQVLAWVLQLGCQWGRCNAAGELCVGWYDTNPSVDKTGKITSTNGATVYLEDVVITGVRVTEYLESTASEENAKSYLVGEKGYVLDISDNKLITEGTGQTVASMIAERVVGMRFRPFKASCLSDPSLEAGDAVEIVDFKGNTYKSYLTTTTFQPGEFQSVACDAASAVRNSAKQYSLTTQMFTEAMSAVRDERTAREQAVSNLSDALASSSGMYSTYEVQPDGSTITYLHDKPTLEASQNVIKITAEAVGVSNDGGKNYPYGFKLTGELIAKLLYVVGIDADYINTGAITVKDKDSNIIFQADMTTGQVIISGDSVRIGGQTATQSIQSVTDSANAATQTAQEAMTAAAQARNMTMQLSNDYQSIPVDSSGNYGSFPTCTILPIVMYGTKDIAKDCTYSITKSSSVTGSWDNNTRTYTVTGLTADTGWVDIKATYLNSLAVVKRFTVAKLYSGTAGKDGKGIKSSAVTYQASTSGTAVPSGTWSTSIPAVAPDQYLWTRTIMTYTDNTSTTLYSVGKMGTNGTPGKDGKNGIGVTSVDVMYYKSTSSTELSGGTWQTTNPGWESGKYIWSKTVITYTDGATDDTDPVCITGAAGSIGSAGKGVKSIVEQYYQSSSATTLSGGSWVTTYPGWANGKYIWTRSVIAYTDNTTTTTAAICVTGDKGSTGAAGVGIKSITEHYAVSSSNSTVPTSWSDTPPAMSTANKYLWNYETVTYTDNTTMDTAKRVIGAYGNTGATGNGVSTVVNYYLATSSSGGVTPSTSGWTTSVQSVTAANKYLWNYEKITYTNGTTSSTDPCIIGTYGDKGATGNGVKSTSITYQASTSGTSVPTGTWTTTIPSVAANQYLWTRTVITYTDNTSSTSYSIGKMGANGTNGAPGRVYMLDCSASVIKQAKDDTMIPSYIDFASYYRDGTSASRTAYAGRFKIEESTDGSTWTTVYQSTTNESKVRYALYTFLTDDDGNALMDDYGYGIAVPRNIASVRCSMYAAGGLTSLLDTQTVVAVKDVDALSHEEIFNLLTNNGSIKGIYKEGNQLYISFTYAKGGQMTLGGSGNGNGKMSILNSAGKQIGYIDNTGAHFFSGEVESSYNNRSTKIGNGRISFLKDGVEIGGIFPIAWGNDFDNAEGVMLSTNAKYATIGYRATSGYSSGYLLNNGLNPDNHTERNILYGSTFITGRTTLNEKLMFPSGAGFWYYSNSDELSCLTGMVVNGNFVVHGTKSRAVSTENYGEIKLNAVESPEAYFIDYGSGIINSEGVLTIFFDPIFCETIELKCDYQVYITATSEKKVTWIEKKNGYFIAHGEEGASFDWQLVCKQRDYEAIRLESVDAGTSPDDIEFDESIFYGDGQDLLALDTMLNEFKEGVNLL